MQIEVSEGSERRRRWSAAEKQALVAKASEPGATVSVVARENGVHPNQLTTWRRQLAAGLLGGAGASGVVPVRVAVSKENAARAGLIEIALPNGALVRVDREVDGAALRRVLEALEQGR